MAHLIILLLSLTLIFPIQSAKVREKSNHELELEANVLRNLFNHDRSSNLSSFELFSPVETYHHGLDMYSVPPSPIEVTQLKKTIKDLFAQQRHHSDEEKIAETRQRIVERFKQLHYEVRVQKFRDSIWTFFGSQEKVLGENIIATLPGANYGTSKDKILVLGGHYDTVRGAPGVDDNGSGSAVILEAARVLAPYATELQATIMFVLFDLEEYGILGSTAFTTDYLIPEMLLKHNSTFLGAFIIDMALLYEDDSDTQELPSDLVRLFPREQSWLEQNDNKGNFIGIWSRKDTDTDLLQQFQNHYTKDERVYKSLALEPGLSPWKPSKHQQAKFSTFFRSDHAGFWYHKNQKYQKTLNAILISDWGPWRGYQKDCYHQSCDDQSQLTDKNLRFLKKSADTLVRVLYNMGK